jgi:hypothetical protein
MEEERSGESEKSKDMSKNFIIIRYSKGRKIELPPCYAIINTPPPPPSLPLELSDCRNLNQLSSAYFD